MTTAEREYNAAQALPGWTKEEIAEIPGLELDAIITVASAYRAVFGRRKGE